MADVSSSGGGGSVRWQDEVDLAGRCVASEADSSTPLHPHHIYTPAPCDDEMFAGEAAVNQAALNPTDTVFEVKRLIGRQFSDEIVQEDIKLWQHVPRFSGAGLTDSNPLVLKGNISRTLRRKCAIPVPEHVLIVVGRDQRDVQ